MRKRRYRRRNPLGEVQETTAALPGIMVGLGTAGIVAGMFK